MTPDQRKALYKQTFVASPEGARVLADLVARFYDVNTFVSGGQEGARASDYKQGSRAAVHFILQQLAQVQEGDTNGNTDA